MYAEAQLSPRRQARGLSTSSTYSSVSSCSASTSPQSERKGHSSWTLPENQRPGEQDTTSFSDSSRRPSRLTAHLHQRGVPSDQGAMPQSPPSSPLPLPHSFNQTIISDISTNDNQRRCKDINEKQCQRDRLGNSPCSGTSVSGLKRSTATKECLSLSSSNRTQHTSNVSEMKGATGSSGRPRFSVSTTSSPRPQACTTVPRMAAKIRSKDTPLRNPSNRPSTKSLPSTESAPSTRISRSKADFYQNSCSARLASSSGPCKEATLTRSTRTSSLCSQTAITTTTTTTTRKVASTTITLGPVHERERHKRAHNAPITSSLRGRKLVEQDIVATNKRGPARDVVLDAAVVSLSDASCDPENTAVPPSTDSGDVQALSNGRSPLLPALDMDTRPALESSDHGPTTTGVQFNATAEAVIAHPCSPTGPSSPTSCAPQPSTLRGPLSKTLADGLHAGPPYGDKPCAVGLRVISTTALSAEAYASLTPPTSPSSTENTLSKDVVAAGQPTTKAQDNAQLQEAPGTEDCTTGEFPEHGIMKASATGTPHRSQSTPPRTNAKDPSATTNPLVTLKDLRNLYDCGDRQEGRIRGLVQGSVKVEDLGPCVSTSMTTVGYSIDLGSKHHEKSRDSRPCNNHDNEQVNDNSNDDSNDRYTAHSKDGKRPLPSAALTNSRPQSPLSGKSHSTGISFRDKMQFLKNQEMRRSSIAKRNQSGKNSTPTDARQDAPPTISALSPSMSPRQQLQRHSRSTPTSLSDFPSSLFSAKHRNAPTFSARTLASVAPAAITSLASTAVIEETKCTDFSSASLSLASPLQDAVAIKTAPRLSVTRSLSSPQSEQLSLRPKCRPRLPLFRTFDALQTSDMIKKNQALSPTVVTASDQSQALSRDPPCEPASPSVTPIGKRDSNQDNSRVFLTTGSSAMNSRRASLTGGGETEELCYFSLPIRPSTHSPSTVSPLRFGRLPMVAEYQERPQDEDPPTGDISILTSRFANLRVMDSLCPMQDALSAQEHDSVSMDASWAAQISQLLNHLADKADLEEEERGVGFATESSTGHQWLRVGSGAGHRAPRGYDTESSGLYRQILRDWLMRLSQLSGAVFETHSGLKREVDKIRWQHNITSATSLPLRT